MWGEGSVSQLGVPGVMRMEEGDIYGVTRSTRDTWPLLSLLLTGALELRWNCELDGHYVKGCVQL